MWGGKDLQRFRFSSLVGLLIPVMLGVWRISNSFYFSLCASFAILVSLYIQRDCWKLGLPAGLTACITEYMGPFLRLWYYVDGYPVFAIFTGFTAIGCAVAVYASMLNWNPDYKKLYCKKSVCNKYIILSYYIAIMPFLFISFAIIRNDLFYLATLALVVGALSIIDRELWKVGIIFAVMGILEEFIGVEMGLWGYEVMPSAQIWPMSFPILTLIFEYFALGCALCFVVSGLGISYFRDRGHPQPKI